MEDSEFPLTRSHREQHARVLGALHRLHRQVMDGDLEPGREAIDNLLPQWFAFHISTMDTALAYTMQMKIAQTAASSTVERESAAGALQL